MGLFSLQRSDPGCQCVVVPGDVNASSRAARQHGNHVANLDRFRDAPLRQQAEGFEVHLKPGLQSAQLRGSTAARPRCRAPAIWCRTRCCGCRMRSIRSAIGRQAVGLHVGHDLLDARVRVGSRTRLGRGHVRQQPQQHHQRHPQTTHHCPPARMPAARCPGFRCARRYSRSRRTPCRPPRWAQARPSIRRAPATCSPCRRRASCRIATPRGPSPLRGPEARRPTRPKTPCPA